MPGTAEGGENRAERASNGAHLLSKTWLDRWAVPKPAQQGQEARVPPYCARSLMGQPRGCKALTVPDAAMLPLWPPQQVSLKMV